LSLHPSAPDGQITVSPPWLYGNPPGHAQPRGSGPSRRHARLRLEFLLRRDRRLKAGWTQARTSEHRRVCASGWIKGSGWTLKVPRAAAGCIVLAVYFDPLVDRIRRFGVLVPPFVPEGSELRKDSSHMLPDEFAGVTAPVWHDPHPALSSSRAPASNLPHSRENGNFGQRSRDGCAGRVMSSSVELPTRCPFEFIRIGARCSLRGKKLPLGRRGSAPPVCRTSANHPRTRRRAAAGVRS
jgi:hypothetical protein